MNREKALNLLIDKIFDQSTPEFILVSSREFFDTYLLKGRIISSSQMSSLRDIFISSKDYSSLISELDKFIKHQIEKDKEGKHWAYPFPREENHEEANKEPPKIGDIFLNKIKNINKGLLDPPLSRENLIDHLKQMIKPTQPEDLFDQIIKEKFHSDRIKFKLAGSFFFTLLKRYRINEKEVRCEEV